MAQTQLLSRDQLIASRGKCDLTDNELRMLSAFAMHVQRQKTTARYLEIGVFGGGTIRFVKDMAPGLACVGVDLFEKLEVDRSNTHISGNYTLQDVQTFVGPEITLIQGDSTQVLPALEGTFDLIFVDGNHAYAAVKQDLEDALRVLAPDGFIALHNCSAHGDPDWDIYNKDDGGPWLLAVELRASDRLRLVGEVDRLAVFTCPR